APTIGTGGEITPQGRKLAKFLDGMDVEHLWLPKQAVNWKTGTPLSAPTTDGKAHTHCSAFVAAACMRLDVYILRPPEHSTVLLANGQFDWLKAEGSKNGWKRVSTAINAQQYANKGFIVVATYKGETETKPGHIAIVRPSTKSNQKIDE